jgi:PAS domain S-box-containing protein
LQESEGQFRMLVEGVTDYAIYMLDPNGIITKWNRGAERIKGYRADEIIGQHFSRFYPEQDRNDGLPARALKTAAKEGRFEAEGWRVRKDGTRLWANVVIDALRDPAGELVGFAKITRDITEKRAAQISLQKAQEERNRAQRMEALGQLTGGVAHDFNNLLMIVSGHLRTLKNLAGEDAKALRAVAAIEGATARGQSLTRQLLTFSRRQSLNPVSTEVGAQLDSCRSMLDSLVGASGRIAISIDRDVWPVLIDADEFELALVNLVVNARDALKPGGLVSISAHNARLTETNAVEGLTGDFVAFSVEDTGHGIAPDILPRIFDPFFTTKSPDRGTGLGLAQVHGFAHQSGGTITARSELGLGTNFTLYLPRADGAPSPAESEPTLFRGEGRRMLLVEDNPAVAEASLLLVEELGFSPHVAPDAAAALEALEHSEFSIVVSDIVMAGEMDGLQLAQAIRNKYPALPVILVSGYNDRAEAARGQFIVLRKPYGATELSRAIARVRIEVEADGESNIVRFNPTHLSR